jgi:hypothetical protein
VFGAVVGGRHPKVRSETQHLVAVAVQPIEQVDLLGSAVSTVVAGAGGRGWRPSRRGETHLDGDHRRPPQAPSTPAESLPVHRNPVRGPPPAAAPFPHAPAAHQIAGRSAAAATAASASHTTRSPGACASCAGSAQVGARVQPVAPGAPVLRAERGVALLQRRHLLGEQLTRSAQLRVLCTCLSETRSLPPPTPAARGEVAVNPAAGRDRSPHKLWRSHNSDQGLHADQAARKAERLPPASKFRERRPLV